MKNTLLALSAVTLLTMPLAATAQQQYGDFYYQQVGGYAIITGYIGPGGTVIIPATVTPSLLPVLVIGNNAFQNNSNLTSVTIPGSVVNIGDHALSGCTSLIAIIVEATNALYSSLDGVLFNQNQTTLIQYPGGKAGNYSIPGSVTNIGDSAFAICSSLTNITIPGSTTRIGIGAFYECSSLSTVTIPVANIGDAAFSYCSSLASVTITGSAKYIGLSAFEGCGGLTNLTIFGGATSIGGVAFGGCTSLTTVTIPGSVTNIGEMVFEGCTGLTSVTLLNGLTSLGDYAFGNCISLTSVTFPNSVTNIGLLAFLNCTRLVAITVDSLNPSYSSADGVLFDKNQTTLVEFPFGKVGSYTIPGNVTNIEDSAFEGCPNLTGVTIPGSVTRIGGLAFYFCTSLITITVNPANALYSSVDGVLFDKSQTALIQYPGGRTGSYEIPDIATSIGNSAFRGCTNLTNVTIPGSVTNIGDYAFLFCTSLKGVFFKGNAPSFGASEFDYANATVYYLPGTSGWGTTFGGVPTRLWNPLMQSSSIGPAGFGFNITGTTDIPIVIEAAANLANPVWVPLQSLNLTNGAFYFSDPNWTNYSSRFYRIRSP